MILNNWPNIIFLKEGASGKNRLTKLDSNLDTNVHILIDVSIDT